MSAETKHSPLPWHISTGCSQYIVQHGGGCIVRVEEDRQTSAGNAALIVRAVNSHGALLEALKRIRKLNCTNEVLNPSMTMLCTEAEAKAAIAAAETEVAS